MKPTNVSADPDTIYVIAHINEEDFKSLQTILDAEESILSKALTPLLEQKASAKSAVRFSDDFRLSYPRGPKCFEFLTLHFAKIDEQPSYRILGYILERYVRENGPCSWSNPPLTQDLKPAGPIMSISNASPDDDKTRLFCIEWESIQARRSLLQDPNVRTPFKQTFKEERSIVFQGLGKTDEDLTWEEEFRVFLLSMGAFESFSQFLTGSYLTDDYLGLNKVEETKAKTTPCCILL